MTRQANPKSNAGFNVKARGESEKKVISDLKTLALQDGVEISDLVFEGLLLMFRVHHWPPGNPQLQLTTFKDGAVPVVKCKCGRVASVNAFHLQSKTEYNYCAACFFKVPMRHDAKE